ncbi:NAD(P)/FAD-dependent oxidoreductase [Spongiactinospora sp. 9N601]|uniref:NAD(P)/FAD-dependent oxidoreductase n=1 Tax=Spongiactinospora sp. 9N601 TaxID=3375149 RepID=UPI003794EBB9
MSIGHTDVVVVGSGIGGAAAACRLAAGGLSVVLLEKQRAFTDLARGEWLAPWGIQEAQRLGVLDCFAVAGACEMRHWVTWDEAVPPEEVESVDMTRFLPSVGGPLSFPHHRVCEILAEQAAASGARVVMEAAKITIAPGMEPVVTYQGFDGPHTIKARMVLGATGRACKVGRQIGVTMTTATHEWGGALKVEGMGDWPADTQALGTEGDVMFMVFPQEAGRARLYMNFPTTNQDRYRGPGGPERFIADYELECLPDRGKAVTVARPAGPLAIWPRLSSVPDRPTVAEGVVLIGDEAGRTDSVLGTGLSCALRDARMVSEVLLAGDDWRPEVFAPFLEERTFRMRRLHYGASIIARLHASFGHEALERRRRVNRLAARHFGAQVTGLLNLVAPEDVPDFGFSEFFAERLFRESA